MKRKHMITLISAVTGAVILSVSAIATYATASGYSTAKNALKNIIYEDNLTMELKWDAKVDGETNEGFSSYKMVQKFDKDGLVKYSSYNGYTNIVFQDGMDIRYYDRNKNNIVDEEDSVYISDYNDNSSAWIFEARDDKNINNYIRFAEALCDTFVGDLKNNVILTDSNDKGDTYSLNLDAYQIPELYQAGIEMIMANTVSEDDYYINGKRVSDMSEDEFYEAVKNGNVELLFSEKPSVQGVNIDVTVDKHSRISDIKAEASIFGEDKFGKSHIFTLEMNFSCYDYGTTVCDRLDLSALENSELLSISSNIDYTFDDIADKIFNINERIENISDEEELEYCTKEKENLEKTYALCNKHLENGDFDRYKELRNSLLFGSLDDTERAQIIAEKEEAARKLEDVVGSRGYYYKEQAEVLEEVIDGEIVIDDEMIAEKDGEYVTITKNQTETADDSAQPEENSADTDNADDTDDN